MSRRKYDKIESVELHVGSGEWSALYVNGELDTVGDHHLSHERIAELYGVTVVQSDDFLRGGDGIARSNGSPPPAQTLEQVHDYARERVDRETRAKRLRGQAADLIKEAIDLEAGKIR